MLALLRPSVRPSVRSLSLPPSAPPSASNGRTGGTEWMDVPSVLSPRTPASVRPSLAFSCSPIHPSAAAAAAAVKLASSDVDPATHPRLRTYMLTCSLPPRRATSSSIDWVGGGARGAADESRMFPATPAGQGKGGMLLRTSLLGCLVLVF